MERLAEEALAGGTHTENLGKSLVAACCRMARMPLSNQGGPLHDVLTWNDTGQPVDTIGLGHCRWLWQTFLAHYGVEIVRARLDPAVGGRFQFSVHLCWKDGDRPGGHFHGRETLPVIQPFAATSYSGLDDYMSTGFYRATIIALSGLHDAWAAQPEETDTPNPAA